MDIEIEGEKKSVLIDTGFSGPDPTIEILIDKANWDKIKKKLERKT